MKVPFKEQKHSSVEFTLLHTAAQIIVVTVTAVCSAAARRGSI